MSRIRSAAIAMIAAATLVGATMSESVAQFKGGGGGGGGARMGGGGGGARMGGGGFGGARMGGGGFGGAKFGGGGFGGARMGGAGFGGARFGGGGMRSYGRPAFRGGMPRSFAGRSFYHRGINRSFTGRSLQGRSFNRAYVRSLRHGGSARALANGGNTRALANRAGVQSRALTRQLALKQPGRPVFRPGGVGSAFAARRAAQWGWYNNWRRYPYAYGWFGPVFWPYAYYDVFAWTFWPSAYAYDPFWDYGYGDIYAGLFSPYGYEEYAAPPPSNGRSSRRRVASAPATSATDARQATMSRFAPLCGDDARELAGIPVDQIQNAVSPTGAQRAALDALANASVQAAQTVKAACPAEIALTAVGRLDAMQKRLAAMLEAVNSVRTPLDNFYNMLSDEQKARFNAIGQRAGQANRGRSLARGCGMSEVAEWPTAEIDRTLQPTPAQRTSLDLLKGATDKAADMLKGACPTELPATPSARLAAISQRLTVMLEAVSTVRGPLETFYSSLNDEQKAQFNAIGKTRAAQR